MKILIIANVWLEPKSSAAGSYLLSIIKSLQEIATEIHYYSTANFSELAYELSTLDIQTQQIKMNDSDSAQLLAKLQPNLVLFDRFMVEEQFSWVIDQHCPEAVKILVSQDLHALRRERQRVVKGQQEINFQHDDFIREVAAIYRCDLSLIVSEIEYQLLQEQFQIATTQLHYLPFLIDINQDFQLDKPIEKIPTFDKRQHFICCGNFRHAPNWDAVLELKQLWPKIRQQLPSAELHLYGAYATEKVWQQHQPRQGFHIKGWCDDLFSLLQKSRVMLAPIRFGAGLKGKLIEAMLAGTPSITSPIGAEGILGEFSWPGRICDTTETFINASVALYQDQQLWENQQQKMQLLLKERFSIAVHQPIFLEKIKQIQQNLPIHRQQHFIGLMLRHHSHRKTEYMSRWIELKEQKIK